MRDIEELYNIQNAIIEKVLKEEEEKIFKEKVADGTLKLIDKDITEFLESVYDLKQEVLFCNKGTKAYLLIWGGSLFMPANILVSENIPDNEIYYVTDKKIKEQCLKMIGEENEKRNSITSFRAYQR